jgi:hypothetical protein
MLVFKHREKKDDVNRANPVFLSYRGGVPVGRVNEGIGID